MTDPVYLEGFEWRQIVDSATDTAIISTDPTGAVTIWNAGAERILGWREQEMVGMTLDRIFAPEGPGCKDLYPRADRRDPHSGV